MTESKAAESQFVYVTFIRTTPEKLWQALTDPEFTRQYWCETWQESAWKPGSSWKIMTPDGKVADNGEIIEIEPPKRLALTWRHELEPGMRAEGFSRLTYELEPVGTTVKLTVIQEIDLSDSKLIKAVSGGWPMILSSLKSLLETGAPLEESRYWKKSN
jgi:uncharacterized protein YndB with AHSA1/START domain